MYNVCVAAASVSASCVLMASCGTTSSNCFLQEANEPAKMTAAMTAKRYFEGLILSGKSKSLKEANAYLRKKGISENIIDKYASTQGSTLQNNSLKSIIDKKCRRQEDLREPSFRNKLIRYLLSKGFNYDDIKTAVDRKASIK